MKQIKPGSKYYEGGVRVIKNGVPTRLAAWYKDLTANGKSLVMQGPSMLRPMPSGHMTTIKETCGCESCTKAANVIS
jgi:hypothetical protein